MFRPGRGDRAVCDAAAMRAAVFGLIAMTACGEDSGAPRVDELRLTAPVGVVELVPVPGEALAVTWRADTEGADDVRLALALEPGRVGDPVVPMLDAALVDGAATWTLPSPSPRPGTFQLTARAYVDDVELATTRSAAIVLVQGVEFRDRALAFTAADVERDVWITATLGLPIDIELVATPAGAATPRHVLARGRIASDLAPIGRVFVWTGTDLDGVALPGGSYDVTVDVTPRDRPVGYTAAGLTVTWTP